MIILQVNDYKNGLALTVVFYLTVNYKGICQVLNRKNFMRI